MPAMQEQFAAATASGVDVGGRTWARHLNVAARLRQVPTALGRRGGNRLSLPPAPAARAARHFRVEHATA